MIISGKMVCVGIGPFGFPMYEIVYDVDPRTATDDLMDAARRDVEIARRTRETKALADQMEARNDHR